MVIHPTETTPATQARKERFPWVSAILLGGAISAFCFTRGCSSNSRPEQRNGRSPASPEKRVASFPNLDSLGNMRGVKN